MIEKELTSWIGISRPCIAQASFRTWYMLGLDSMFSLSIEASAG